MDTATISKYVYTVNPIGQRTSLAQTGTAFATAKSIAWGYDPLGQVTTADSTENTQDRAYQYDTIGNRQKSADSLTLPAANNYTANALNQYTAITGQPAGRTQDDDGNLTTGTIPADLTANSTLVWDAENRLVKITKPNGDVVDFDYDYMSRRISKKVTGNEAKITVYDSWNPIVVYSVATGVSPVLAKTYTWGTDLSGSIQGAGGVGGLLSVHQHGTDPNNQTPITNNYFPTFDGNGNVSEYLSATGTVVAHYEYDTFGNTIVKTGVLADSFAHRFSTKYLDVETGFYYYGYRIYNPITGRWESRDPLGERGGLNLYGFVRNNSVFRIDRLGMEPVWISSRAHIYWRVSQEVSAVPLGTLSQIIVRVAKKNENKYDGDIGDCPKCALIYVHGIGQNEADGKKYAKNIEEGYVDARGGSRMYAFLWASDTGFGSDYFERGKWVANENAKGPFSRFIRDFKSKCPDTKLNIVSHSLGARIVLGALQSGEGVNNIGNVALIAPAVDNEVLESGEDFGNAYKYAD